jgi:HNH endonuclease
MPGSIDEQVRYDPETGDLWWISSGFKRNTLKPAGYVNGSGHKAITIDGKSYYQHRIAWLLQTGEWPPDTVDHINGNPADNRWCNLRLATKAQNNANKKSSAKWKGIWFNPKTKKWRAQCGGGKYYVGEFDCPVAAHLAYQVEAAKRYGEFSRAA